MPLLSHTDLEDLKNVDLTTEGQALADTRANSILAWAAKRCHRPGWNKVATTEYFSPDDYQEVFYVSRLPLDTAEAVTVSTYNASSNSYNAYTGTVRTRDTGVIKTGDSQPCGYEAVKISYTGGYTALPDDLKHALTELLVQKWDAAENGGKVLSEVKAIDYSEKYTIDDRDVPMDIQEVVDSYMLPVVC